MIVSKNPLIPTENDVAKQITDWLDYFGYFWHYVPNKGRFDHGQDKKTLGAPDIVVITKGRYIGVEFKAPGKGQTKEQKEFRRRLEQVDGKYVLARDINDLIPVLRDMGGRT
jgi:hypothetical protein